MCSSTLRRSKPTSLSLKANVVQCSMFNVQRNMYDVQGNLREVLSRLPQGVRLVAISKYHPNEYIEAAYAEGQRTFGESHEQELRQKHETLPKDIEWHFIGHLQTNKVKYIAPYVTMIEAVDSLKLLREIDKQAAKNDRVIDVLLELHIAEEETKYGLTPDALRELMAGGEWRQLQHVRICGLMMMASYVDDEEQIRSESLGADAESHGSQTWQRNRVTLSGPRLNHLASCIPAGLHNSLANSAAQSSLLNHLLLTERGVQLRDHYKTILAFVLADLNQLFLCLYF